MAARSESWSRPAELGPAVVLVGAALFLFSVSWLALQHGFYRRDQIRDTRVYKSYGDAIASGRVPYRDFRLEYPPAALPVFVVPALPERGREGFEDFRRGFEGLMIASGCAALVFLGLALRTLGRAPPQQAAALCFAALAPLALGSVVLSRFDLWPVALVAAAIWLLLSGRGRLAFGVLGLAVGAKVYPAILAPLFAVYVWRRRGRREALVALGVLGAAVAVLLVPFLVIAPDGVWWLVVRQTTRPLQLESLGSAVLLAAHHVGGLGLTMRASHGSQNLAGALPDAVGAALTVAQALGLAAVYVWFARGPAGRERLVRAAALALAVFVALGKVLSPQFLLWLVFVVPLVRGRRGLAAGGVLGSALVLTQLWFPYRYWDFVFTFDATTSWLILARDLVLLGLVAVLAWPDRREHVEAGIDELGGVTWDGRPISSERPFGTAVVVWRNGADGREWLVLHRVHRGPDYEGAWAWGPPSGARLPGETLEECARRELAEEAGLELEPSATACGTDDWAVFAVEAPAGAEISLSAEHDAFRWLPLDEAAGRCLPPTVGEGLRAVAATLPD